MILLDLHRIHNMYVCMQDKANPPPEGRLPDATKGEYHSIIWPFYLHAKSSSYISFGLFLLELQS